MPSSTANTTAATTHNVRHRAREEQRMLTSEKESRSQISGRRRLSGYDHMVFRGKVIPMDGGESPERQAFHFIHIPKTSGDSFMADSSSHMPVGATLQGNIESGYLFSKHLFHNQPKHFSVVFLREPISHVQSQFLECKYDPYYRKLVNKTEFPGYYDTKNAMEGFTEWIKYFVDIGNDESDMGVNAAYKCYDPWNMQSRYFTSTVHKVEAPHYAFSASDRVPPLEMAKRNLEKVDVVGIVEHYAASLCLFEYRAFGKASLSNDCQYCDPKTHTLSRVNAHTHHSKHYSPPHSVNMIPEATLQLIKEKLTLVDQELYKFALDLFHKEVEEVKHATGIDLLCRNNTSVESYQVSFPSQKPTMAPQPQVPTLAPVKPTIEPQHGGLNSATPKPVIVSQLGGQIAAPVEVASSQSLTVIPQPEFRNLRIASSVLMELGLVLFVLALYFVFPRWRTKVQIKPSCTLLPQRTTATSSTRKQTMRL